MDVLYHVCNCQLIALSPFVCLEQIANFLWGKRLLAYSRRTVKVEHMPIYELHFCMNKDRLLGQCMCSPDYTQYALATTYGKVHVSLLLLCCAAVSFRCLIGRCLLKPRYKTNQKAKQAFTDEQDLRPCGGNEKIDLCVQQYHHDAIPRFDQYASHPNLTIPPVVGASLEDAPNQA